MFTGQIAVNEEDKITEKEQALYQSGVGMLLYLTKQTVPML